MENKTPKTELTAIDLSYLAGFIDSEGSIGAYIRPAHGSYGFTIRTVIIIRQSTRRHDFLLQLQESLGSEWTLHKDADGMSSLRLDGFKRIKSFLVMMKPYIEMKAELLRLVLEIIEDHSNVQSKSDFLAVCRKVDRSAEFMYSSGRKYTCAYVENHINFVDSYEEKAFEKNK